MDINPSNFTMKMKKIIAGLCAATMAISVLGMSVFAEGEDEGAQAIETTAVVTEPATEQTTAEPTTTAEPAETTPVTTTVTTTTTKGSPKTGNVTALAAVPVALAAVAVLAKNRKK